MGNQGYGGAPGGCCNQISYGYGTGYGAAIILVLFILLVIVTLSCLGGNNFNN